MSGELCKTVARCGLAAFALVAPAWQAAAADYTLERVVLVSRHGVRAPTDSATLVEFTRSKDWPKWPVKDAFLTLRGKMLASRMGAYYAQELAKRGLFGRPPATKDVYVWADLDQRTRETGAGLLEGIFGCQDSCPSPGSDYGTNDALFHPTHGGVCKIDPDTAEKAVKAQAGGSLENALKPYLDTVWKLQETLDCCAPRLCNTQTLTCSLETLPSKIKKTKDGVALEGPISVGSTASEVFLLEYAQDMPEVAWKSVSASAPDQINALLKLHDLQFNLLQRTPYLAKRQGSALVQQVLETLRQTVDGKASLMRPVPREAKLVIYVGHDTNLANIGGILGVDWDFKSGLGDKTPPAGAMVFELLRDAPGARFVKMAYYAQTLDQMRAATPLTPELPPDRADIAIKFCSSPQQDGACPWAGFYEPARKLLDPDCVGVKAP
jgi:4-phytase/acid phosphatase